MVSAIFIVPIRLLTSAATLFKRALRVAITLLTTFGFLITAAPVRAAGNVTDCSFTSLVTALQGGGTVTLSCDSTIVFTNTIAITNDITIDATNHSPVFSGNNAVRLFNVQSNGSLKIIGVTVMNGNATGTNGVDGTDGRNRSGVGDNGHSATGGGDAFAGAIYNLGILRMTGCSISSNSVVAGNGGDGGNGGTGGFGGGNGGNGGNAGKAFGGAIYNAGMAFLTNCTIANNTITGGNGGNGGSSGGAPGHNGDGGAGGVGNGAGIFNRGTLTINSSTFSDNSARGGNSMKAGPGSNGALGLNGDPGGSGLGGGIYSTGVLAVVNCTFASNKTGGGNGGDGGEGDWGGGNGGNGGLASGGGIYSAATAGITNCTLSSNSVSGGTNGLAGSGGSNGSAGQSQGGNIARGAGTFVLANSIIANASSGGNGYPSTITDAGYNVSSDNSVNLAAAGSLKNTNANLGTLSSNGGPTQTIMPLIGSPAIDRGSAGVCLATDQRGAARPAGAACDAGAVETAGLVIQTPLLSDESNFFFTFNSATGFTYYVEYKDSLSDSNWIRLRTNVGNGNIFTNLVPIGGTTSRFFRVSVP
jgi:hypothetical protein